MTGFTIPIFFIIAFLFCGLNSAHSIPVEWTFTNFEWRANSIIDAEAIFSGGYVYDSDTDTILDFQIETGFGYWPGTKTFNPAMGASGATGISVSGLQYVAFTYGDISNDNYWYFWFELSSMMSNTNQAIDIVDGSEMNRGGVLRYIEEGLVDSNVNPVPEPTTILLLGTGLVGLAAGARRKMKKA